MPGLSVVSAPATSRLPVAPGRLTIGRFVDDVAARGGSHEAVVDGDRRLTYDGLRAEVHRVARALVALGVSKGERVALLMGNRLELVTTLLAGGAIGAVVVPVSTYAPADERHHVLRHSDASTLVVSASLAGHRYVDDLGRAFPALAQGRPGRLLDPGLPGLRRVVVVDPDRAVPPFACSWEEALAAGADVPDGLVDALAEEVHPADDALLLYTSGTTATPKAVLHRQRAPVHQGWLFAQELRVTRDERVWSNLPLFWSAGLAMFLLSTLAGGGTVVLQERFEPGEALALLERERVTTIHAPVHVATQLAEHADFAHRDLSAVRRVAARNPLRGALGLAGDTWDPAAAYGQSETFAQVTSVPADAPAELRHTTHGVPLPGAEIAVVDPRTGDPVPIGEAGEIAVRGVTVMRGYYKADEQPFDARGYLRTGDAGRITADGHLHWDGRLTRVIRSAGANVSPVEVEDLLHRTGRVELSLVVGVPHPSLGEAVVAVVARPDGAAALREDDLLEHLRGRLASYKVPRRVLFVDVGAFPLTGTDKVRADAVRDVAVALLLADEATDRAWRAHLLAVAGARAGATRDATPAGRGGGARA